MSFFKKKVAEPAGPVTCPICGDVLTGEADHTDHWMGHIKQIPPGNGEASGQFTWTCGCGPSEMKWPGRGGAVMALQYHLGRAHGIPTMEEFLLASVDGQPNMRRLQGRLS